MSQSKIDLGLSACKIRELRLGSLTGYYGDAELLVEQSCCGQQKNKDRSFSQCLGCSTTHGACTTILVQDGAVISHGPVGCSACLHDFAFTYRVNAKQRGLQNVTQRKIYTTNLEEKDTIYGGNLKLEQTIREVWTKTDDTETRVWTADGLTP